MIFSTMSQMTPRSAVDAIAPLLSRTGELKGDDEAVSLLDSMKEATMLFQKAIYLCVLKNTTNDKILNTYLVKGGWDLLNNWLTDAKKTGNNALAIEILEVLQHIPVTLALLRQGNMGKVVKSFNKLDNKDIKKIAAELLDSWMKVVKDTPTGKKKKGQDRDDDGISKKDQLVPKKGSSKSAPLAESLGFLDAITSTSSKGSAPRKVRKRSSTDVDMKRSNSLTETPEASPSAKSYKTDRLSLTINKPDSPKVQKYSIKPQMLLSNSPPPLPDKSHGNDNMFCFRRAKKRRRIRWKEDLEDIQFFECDEKTGHKSFADSMIKEYEKERLAVLRSRQLGEDMMVEMNTWKHPLKLDASMLTLADRGTSSKEKEIQREREKNVLAVLVFDQNAMDESPKEPEPEDLVYQYVAPMIIPLSDDSASQQQQPVIPVLPPEPEPRQLEQRQPDQRHPDQRHPDQRHPDQRHPDQRHPDQRHPDQRHPDQRHPDQRHPDPQRYHPIPDQQRHPEPPPMPQQLPPVLANMIHPQMPHPLQPVLPPPDMLPNLLPIPDYNLVQRYPQYHAAPRHPPPLPPTTYNSYNPDHRYDSHNRNGREHHSNRQDQGGWNYRKGGHGGRQYREWIEGDRHEASDKPRGPRPRKHCSFFNTVSGCRSGKGCMFVHEPGVPAPPHVSRWDDRGDRDRRNVHIHGGEEEKDRDRRNVHIHGGEEEKDGKAEKESPKSTETQENTSPSTTS